jgi:hypothetical protein
VQENGIEKAAQAVIKFTPQRIVEKEYQDESWYQLSQYGFQAKQTPVLCLH